MIAIGVGHGLCRYYQRRSIVRTKLPDDEREIAKALLGFLDHFTDLSDTMPHQYIKAFLAVALEEGLGVGDYAQRAGISMTTMSRHLHDIGERNRHMEKGFGLVTYRANPTSLRQHEYTLRTKAARCCTGSCGNSRGSDGAMSAPRRFPSPW